MAACILRNPSVGDKSSFHAAIAMNCQRLRQRSIVRAEMITVMMILIVDVNDTKFELARKIRPSVEGEHGDGIIGEDMGEEANASVWKTVALYFFRECYGRP